MRLELNEVDYGVEGTQILDSVTMGVDREEFVGVIGPNGSGKTTALKCMAGLIAPTGGEARLDGAALPTLSRRDVARKVGVVGQEMPVSFDFSVHEIVMMGRTPHKGFFEPDTPDDDHIVMEVLEEVGAEHLAERSYQTLSGGEKQRILIARCLAQQAEILLLDEPTNHLDIRYQLQVMDLVRDLNFSVLTALHDMNLGALYCDRIYVLKGGTVVEQGTPDEVLTEAILSDVFERTARVQPHPVTGGPYVFFAPEPADKS